MPTRIVAATSALALAAVLCSGNPALADAIDGHWCAGGAMMTIEGDDLTTPGKHKIVGDYARHAYSYTVPAGEPGAGAKVSMILVDDDTVHLRQAESEASPVQTWKRCKFTT